MTLINTDDSWCSFFTGDCTSSTVPCSGWRKWVRLRQRESRMCWTSNESSNPVQFENGLESQCPTLRTSYQFYSPRGKPEFSLRFFDLLFCHIRRNCSIHVYFRVFATSTTWNRDRNYRGWVRTSTRSFRSRQRPFPIYAVAQSWLSWSLACVSPLIISFRCQYKMIQHKEDPCTY